MSFDFEKALSPLAGETINDNLAPTNTETVPAPAAAEQAVGIATGVVATQEQAPTNQPNTPPAVQAPTPEQYAEYLDRMSGGLIKDESGFLSVLPQLNEYPTLKAKADGLASQLEKAPKFANDEVRIYNELVAQGKSREQLKNFQKINEVGDIKELSPIDARIARMVLVDGVKESVAKLIVEREFKIGDESIEDTDREILDEQLRVAANKDREALDAFKAKVSDTGTVPAEELALQQAARVQEHTKAITPLVNNLVNGLPHLGEFDILVEDAEKGTPGYKYTIPITDEIKTEMNGYVKNFLMDGLMEPTQENYITALSYARAETFRTHASEIFKAFGAEVIAQTEQRMIDKYENRSGLRMQQDNPRPGGNPAAETAGFMADVANRRVK